MTFISLPLPSPSGFSIPAKTFKNGFIRKNLLELIPTPQKFLEKGHFTYRVLVKPSTSFSFSIGKNKNFDFELPEEISLILHSNKKAVSHNFLEISELTFFTEGKKATLRDFYEPLKEKLDFLKEKNQESLCIITLNGLGLKARKAEEKLLELSLGKAHLIYVKIPESVSFDVVKEIFPFQGGGDSQRILLTGEDLQTINDIADSIIKLLPPEPYKGKGIIIRKKKNLAQLQVFRKEGKKNKSLMQTKKLLFQARTHIGHSSSLRHPDMSPYIYGRRKGIDIIDIRQTEYHLKIALQVVQKIYNQGGIILFHLDEPTLIPLVEPLIPKNPQIFVHTGSWIGGLLTNWDQMEKHARNTNLKNLPLDPRKDFHQKFAPFLSILNINGNKPIPKPSIAITFKAANNYEFLNEAWKSLTPSVGFADTNTNPSLITYPIPANDDHLKALYLYVLVMLSPFSSGKTGK